MTERLSSSDVKAAANDKLSTVLALLGINERPRGATGYIAMSDPTTKDRNPSLVIWTKRPGGLSWKRYGSDAKGDIIDLVAYIRGWFYGPKRGAGEAIRWLKDKLGLETIPRARLNEDLARARLQQATDDKKSAEKLERDRGRAQYMFFNAADWRGSVVETYLTGLRGLDLAALPHIPRFFRYLADHPHRDKAGIERPYPCMIACCVDPVTGKLGAVHRTWLAADGSDKAPVAPARKVWPDYAGYIIPIWKGVDNFTVRQACEAGVLETLIVTEGVEDGLTAALSSPGHRVWAAVSLSNMVNIKLPACIDSVILHRQNDWKKLQAVEAFERAREAIEAQGRPVAEASAFGGKDWNDTLRGEAL